MPHTIRLMACAVLILMVSVTTRGPRPRRRSTGPSPIRAAASLPGAAVTATQTDTGFRREVVTDHDGFVHADQPADRTVSSRSRRSPASAPTCRPASCCRSTAIR